MAKGLRISDFIRPMNIAIDSYPTHLDIFGKGGLHSVATLPDRDAISEARRSSGMLAFTQDEHTMYSLLGGDDNVNWQKLFDFSDGKVNFNIACDYNYVLLGNLEGVAKPAQTIVIDNLPPLGVTHIVNPFTGHFIGEVWEGSSLLRPEPSSIVGDMFADILLINSRFATANFILGHGSLALKTFMPAAQFLDTLQTGILKQEAGVISIAASDDILDVVNLLENYIFVGNGQNRMQQQQRLPSLDNLPPLVEDYLWIGGGGNFPVAKLSFNYINFPTLTNKYILAGNADNKVTATLQLDVLNLPDIKAYHIFAGGVDDKISVVDTLNSKFLVMEGRNELPNGVSLGGLADGLLVKDGGTIKKATLTHNKIWQGDAQNQYIEVNIAEAGIASKNATYILQSPDANLPNAQDLKSISGLLGGLLKVDAFGVVSLALGGNAPLVDDYVKPSNLAEEEAARIGADGAIEAALGALELEMQAEIAALAGVVSLDILGTILGFIGVTAGGKAYGEYIRGQTLNVKNTWRSSDLNDEGHNAVGDYEFRYPSGYSSDDRGRGTLWFDSKGRNATDKGEGGLRVMSWDSGGDHLGFDSPLAPAHIGIFGYQNKYHIAPIPNPTPIYQGFIFRSEFYDDNSNDNYRLPKNFGLYDVKRTISTLSTQRFGWQSEIPIFEYNHEHFNFFIKIINKDVVKFEKNIIIDATTTVPTSSGTVFLHRVNI